jgi:F-type H+-transporting ATPase subunit alpha
LRLDLAQYRSLEAFAKFGSDLDKTTQSQLTRGSRLVELLKQTQYVPMSVEKQVAVIFAANTGKIDKLPLDSISRFEAEYLEFLESKYPNILDEIRDKKALSDELREKMSKSVEEFLKMFKTES